MIGSLEVVPMARCGLGGELGRRVKRWPLRARGSGKVYCFNHLLAAGNSSPKVDEGYGH